MILTREIYNFNLLTLNCAGRYKLFPAGGEKGKGTEVSRVSIPDREERRNRRGTGGRVETADVALSKPNGQNGQPPSVMAQ